MTLLLRAKSSTSSVTLLITAVVVFAAAITNCQTVVLQGTDADAEYLSAVTKDAHERNYKKNDVQQLSSVIAVGESRQASSGGSTNSSAASAIASQVSTALSQLDLGLGYYKMCPFPFSYLHQCEASSDCPGSDCCGMYAFPGPNRWRRSCCVPDSVTTIARVASLCIKGPEKPANGESGGDGGSRPLIPSASSVFQNVVAQALGVGDSGSDDDDEDIKKH
ncbi:hypothetical protein BIW11_05528 [Tropilaelaps mercedesae]|uniref:Uncharacterized protein n=1 Tax=Tropilaelaps mercedesae TaxID=418985 RepID=A0A1V9Y2A5_9ACAR|nr:hypothetical protein BIW11_05528 [Tropilaelaps mercedesae]